MAAPAAPKNFDKVFANNDLEKRIMEAFEVFDHSAKQVVDVREVGTILRSLGCCPTEEEVQEVILATENKEATGTVPLTYFLPYMSKAMVEHRFYPASAETLLAAFRYFDEEGRGFITKERFAQLMLEEGEPFTQEEYDEMIQTALDPVTDTITYEFYINQLMAILIFGISGACRRQELANINVSDIENHGDLLLVKIPDTKNKIPRTFTIHGEFYAIVKKYQALRITNAKSNRFFQKYQNGKCMRQVVGVNKIGSVPKEIATFLKLDNPASYTGHSFRSTSARLLANSRADIITLKRHGGWRSNNVAEGYIEDSVHNKIEIGDKISKCININNGVKPRPSTSRENVQPLPPPLQVPPLPTSPPSSPTFTPHSPVQLNKCEINNVSQSVKLPKQQISLNFNNCSNFTINFQE